MAAGQGHQDSVRGAAAAVGAEQGGDPERAYVLRELASYWPQGEGVVRGLPMPRMGVPAGADGLAMVALPEWAADLGGDGGLLCPAGCTRTGPGPAWERTDWLGAAFWMLSGAAERAREARLSPIHSEASRMPELDPRLRERAWVNRIALFLRRWAARLVGRDESELLGAFPAPRIWLTHDVDAVSKTWAIRVKQAAFRLRSAAWAARRWQPKGALAAMASAAVLGLGRDEYWCFDRIMDAERRAGVRSIFMFHARPGARRPSLRARLLDPGYEIGSPRLRGILRRLRAEGNEVGLHQSYESWDDAGRMREEKLALEEALGDTVQTCRQHWLRFSWARTWRAQESAGLLRDSTLGYNDVPGFRNGAALEFHPWDGAAGSAMGLTVVPMVVMDSHLYADTALDDAARAGLLRRLLDEVAFVRGVASVNWHQQTFADDYGWGRGYGNVLSRVQDGFLAGGARGWMQA